jgi:thiamine biosynthesis protein ThiS
MKREIEILLNGDKRVIAGVHTVKDLIRHLELETQQIAVEVNRSILKRDSWGKHTLQSGDVVEIVHFVGGGNDRSSEDS